MEPKAYIQSDSDSKLPLVNEPVAMYQYLRKNTIGSNYINLLSEVITLTDEVLAKWLNITTRTLRNYRAKESQLKDNTKEHIISLLSLYKHGTEAFESKEKFEKWLTSENYFLDNKPPMDFLETISGIQLIDNRITAMEFGENV